ncbi:RDD family protein [Microbacterium sp.]|uniref:RDD family protein n=1 Tax=Microbacterium sp. TaxID=51671 RepID=UPI002732C3CF|nr:RDD family protein [Microbacterium sp.]MDP3950477.1 RDD family protein [Microbacterium sp.]
MTQLAFGTVAPTSRRAVAYIIDAAIAAGIGIVLSILLVIFAVLAGPDGMLGVLAVGGPVVWLVLVGWLVFYTFMQAAGGSIGMRAQGLRLVQEADGAPLGFGRALLRNVIFGLAASIVVGYFTPLFDGSGRFQGWHDKVARSLMLDARTVGARAAAPATQAMNIPPRPVAPNAVPPLPGRAPEPTYPSHSLASTPGGVPPVPGLTPAPSHSSPESIAYAALVGQAPTPGAPALDETIPAPRPPQAAPPAAQAAQPASQPAPFIPQSAPQQPAGRPTIAQPPAPTSGENSLIAFVPGITQDGPPERSAEAPAAPPAAAPVVPPTVPPVATPAQPAVAAQAPSEDVGDVEDTRISIPGHRLVFTWDDGTRVTVSQRTLFGRNPAPEEGAVAVIVRDETLSLSKTHFEAAAEVSGGWVKDRHSTNGTVIVRDGERIPCTPGEAVRVRLGDAIEIGDRIVTIGGYA